MGAGGTGGYYGGMLARAGFDVCFIARGEHLKAIQQNGLKVVTTHGEFLVRAKATDEPSQVDPVDLVLFCVKAYDTDEAARAIIPLLAKGGSVLTIQNGVDNRGRIGAILGNERVLSGVAYITSQIESPGIVRQGGGPRSIIFGEANGERTERAEHIYEAMRSAGINCELSNDIGTVLWGKFIWVCGFAGVTCLARAPIGVVMANPETRMVFREMMEEVAKVAIASGIVVQGGYVDRMMDFADHFEKKAIASMYYDLRSGRRMELQALHGTVVRLGREYGVPTPVNSTIYGALKPYESGRPAEFLDES